MTRRALPALSLVAVSGLALVGCSAASGDSDGSEGVSIVASTSVYADLVSSVVGDAADVQALIDSPTVDPHEYEATVQDQRLVTQADLVVFNGGGYDSYMEELVEAGGVEHSVMAVECSHDYPGGGKAEHAGDDHADGQHTDEEHADHADVGEGDHAEHDHAAEEEHAEEGHDGHDHIEGFNEHIWYDPHTIVHVVEQIAADAGELIPDEAETFAANAESLVAELEGLEGELEGIAADHGGYTVAFTEPIGGYLTAAAGLEDVTANGFAEAVEEGQEVAPAVLLQATSALEGGEVDVLVVNPQTAGPETDAVIEAAEQGGVPIVEYTETLPDGETYASWMQSNIDALRTALDG